MVKLDEDTIVTGSSDGLLRILSLQPNKMLGVLGAHADYPIERLTLSEDARWLASASHDSTIKVWDLSVLHDDDDEEGAEIGSPDGGQDGKRSIADRAAGAERSDASTSDDSGDEEEGADGRRRVPSSGTARARHPHGRTSTDEEGGASPNGSDRQHAREGGTSASDDASDSETGSSGSDSSSGAASRRAAKKRRRGAHRIPAAKDSNKGKGNFFAGLL